MKLSSVDDSIFIFLSYMVFILDQGLLLSNNFMSKLSSSKFCYSTQGSADACIVALLVKLPQMTSCSTNNANLDKNNIDMFYKIDCCDVIYHWIWMNNLPNESRIIMLSCTEISFVIYNIFVFCFLKFGVKPGFLAFNSHCRPKVRVKP